MCEKIEAIKIALAIFPEARKQVPGASAKLIIVLDQYRIMPEEIGSTKIEVKKIARDALIERTLALMAEVVRFEEDFDTLVRTADFTFSQRSIAERLKRSVPSETLVNEARSFQVL
jgi:hypothetical protein